MNRPKTIEHRSRLNEVNEKIRSCALRRVTALGFLLGPFQTVPSSNPAPRPRVILSVQPGGVNTFLPWSVLKIAAVVQGGGPTPFCGWKEKKPRWVDTGFLGAVRLTRRTHISLFASRHPLLVP